MSFEPSDKIGGRSEEGMVRFLTEPWNARIAALTADGWPNITRI
jgi:hypothetical protein